jgi:hypothetical protein
VGDLLPVIRRKVLINNESAALAAFFLWIARANTTDWWAALGLGGTLR